MKMYSLILVCLISFAFISKAQTLQVSWDDENYDGYGNSGWLDSDEFILTVTINSIIIDN